MSHADKATAVASYAGRPLKERLLQEILPRVSKPARYLGDEVHSVHKDPAKVAVRFALAFPDVYEVGMSHLGLKILYHILNQREDVWAERAFSPWTDMEAELRARGLPAFSQESATPLAAFDILGFTLQYELSYSNVLNLLDLAGIPLLSSQRGAEWPLVVAGGPCVFNPEPMADFIDVFVIGDGEEAVLDLVDAVRAWRQSGRAGGKPALLEKLARLEGFYVPSLYSVRYTPDGRVAAYEAHGSAQLPVRKRLVRDLDRAPFPDRFVVPYLEAVHDRAMVEVARGCTRGCRFCQAGMIYRPVRERRVGTLRDQTRQLLDSTGYEEVSLSSLSTADYSAIRDLLQAVTGCVPPTSQVSLPSLRVDSFSVALAEQLHAQHKGGITFAPEAGTQRLRDVINKGVTEADLLSAVSAAAAAGWTGIKLYFMIGLPTETDEDVAGIAQLAEKALAAAQQARAAATGDPARIHVTVSVSSFVPKAHTPFQWEAQASLEQLRAKQVLLQKLLRRPHLAFHWHEGQASFLEGVLSRADRRVGKALLRAHQLGCKFDGWSEQFQLQRWLQAFAETGLDPAFYAQRQRGDDEVFPWEVVDPGVSRRYLWRERQKALAAQTTPDCRLANCSACGVCPGYQTKPWLEKPQAGARHLRTWEGA